MTGPIQDLSTAQLKALAASLRTGPLSLGISVGAIQQIAGANAQALKNCLETLSKSGMSALHIAALVEALVEARNRTTVPEKILELVLSGPDVAGVPTSDTSATMQTLIEEGKKEILLIGYVVHHARRLFERLAKKLTESSGLRVAFCLDISRKLGDTSLDSEIVKRFAMEFSEKHWPWRPLPELYYDPRSLSENPEHRSSLHAKCVIVDRQAALVTSANFTDAAQNRNIEVGVLIRHAPIANRVAEYFEGLKANKQLVSVRWGH
jgi:hypothetical protein